MIVTRLLRIGAFFRTGLRAGLWAGLWTGLWAVLPSGCSSVENAHSDETTRIDAGAVAGTEVVPVPVPVVPVHDRLCRTYGFRNWSLRRGEDAATLGGEASVPTPAWSVVLHEAAGADDESIELIVETIEPSGLSITVVSWVSFEKTLDLAASREADVTVRCGGEIVWDSRGT